MHLVCSTHWWATELRRLLRNTKLNVRNYQLRQVTARLVGSVAVGDQIYKSSFYSLPQNVGYKTFISVFASGFSWDFKRQIFWRAQFFKMCFYISCFIDILVRQRTLAAINTPSQITKISSHELFEVLGNAYCFLGFQMASLLKNVTQPFIL